MKHRRIKRGLACMAMIGLGVTVASGADMLLVENGISKVPIIVAADAPPATTEAVKELAAYIQKISGAKPEIVTNTPDPLPESAIWVGAHANLPELFPGANLAFTYPEEILNLCNGRNLLIAGRDLKSGTNQVENGTANSVYTFIEKKLDVRWLWPGELGEDIIKRETLAFAPFEYRFHPVFLKRLFWPGWPKDWYRHQRMLYYSYPLQCGHGFTDWWEKYGETHPEYFALQANGTRTPMREGSTVKLCLSNPGVWTQWLDNVEARLKNDPSIRVISATPNDGPWHCSCENCRAWDHPDAPVNVLTDRHVKFWNILARRLKERFPDREVYVGAAAYAAYGTPPIAEKLEPNIALAQVGYFPFTDRVSREEQKRGWKKWADLATLMWYRPNLWYWAGGVWGLPEVSIKRTIEDFRFLADNKCIGIEIDVLRNVWSTQGPAYYLMAQLTYDPLQDGEVVIKDYYRRAFGPAASEMEAYWTLLEDTCEALMAEPDFKVSSGARYKLPDIFVRIYSPEWMVRAEHLLKEADAKVAESDLYRRRIAFVRVGLDYTRLLIQTIPLMTRVRESQGRDAEAVRQAQANWEAIAAVGEKAEPFALPVKNIRDSFIGGTGYQGHMQDYFGPPSEELLNAKNIEVVKLLPASWSLAFTDDFQRTEPGSDWEIKEGKWTVEDGCLMTTGEGSIMMTRSFLGLQKVEFEATLTPNPGVSDISPFIQSGTNGPYSAYFLRFGGNYNTVSGIMRQGKIMQESQRVIEPNKMHKFVAEYDGAQVRLTVDGEVVAAFSDDYPLIGEEHDRIGIYTYEGIVKIRNLKVYTSRAIKVKAAKTEKFDNGGEGEGFE